MEGKFRVRSLNLQRLAPIFLLLVLLLVISVTNTNFMSAQAIFNLFLQVSPLGIVAFGAMLVLLTGGIDFTAGYGMSLAGITAGYVYITYGNHTSISLILVSAVIGLLAGLLNGLIITKLKLHPFIVTLAMMSAFQGLSMMISEGRQVVITSPFLLTLGQGRLFGFLPVSFIAYLLILGGVYFVVNHTKIGTYAYAIGGNKDAVVYSGINENLYEMAIYGIAGLLYGLAGVITVSQVTVITANISGTVLLDGIAAAIVGGTSLLGGRGTVGGTCIGTFIIILISTLLTFLGIPPLLRDALKGLIIIGILLFDTAIRKNFRGAGRKTMAG
jgi:ribose/xylose/arabinose/galactoside ABC-type transport system permease subunit